MSSKLERAGKINSAGRALAKKQLLANTYLRLKDRQSAYKTLFGSLLGAVISLLLFAALAFFDLTFLLLYLVPPIFVGLGARWLGRCFDWPLLLIPAACSGLVYLITFSKLLPFNSANAVIILAGISLATYTAKISLSELEKQALWQAKMDSVKDSA